MTSKKQSMVPIERIENKIFLIRGQKIMMDKDLAKLYGVETKYLKRQVRRNIDRFPKDFMFQLSKSELDNWRSQFVTSNSSDKMGLRYAPYAFTEHGVAMLSSVLNSKRAIQVNIAIMRTFTKLRDMISTHKDLKRKLKDMEKKYDKQFQVVFQALEQLLEEPESKPKKQIGFH
ncbi:MAG: ORF6N domain-containing protein [Candidatus Omnitrophota bacterium]